MITVDKSRSPLVVVTFNGAVDDPAFATYLRELDDPFSGGKGVMIYDATHAAMTPASQRRMQAEWMKQHDERTRETTLGIAFVIPSAIGRGVLTAILWMQPMPCPYVVMPTLASAVNAATRWTRDLTSPALPAP